MRTLRRLLLSLLMLSVVTDMPIPDGFNTSLREGVATAGIL
jgi:hypothetical protein